MKKGRFLFQLTKTINQQAYEPTDEENTPLLKLAADDHRHFVLEQRGKRRRSSTDDQDDVVHKDHKPDDPDLAPEITQMIEQHLKLSNTTPGSPNRKRKPSKKHFTGSAAEIVSLSGIDYVYDIYHLESVPEKEFDVYKQESDVGFVKIVYANLDLVPDEDSDTAQKRLSDDEDSNEENYYQNDYPEDEDDDRSILFGSEGEDLAVEETLTVGQADGYEDLFNRLGENNNILSSLNAMNFIDLDADEGPSPSDREQDPDEDPMVAYRDRIFGDLQRMIDDRS